MFDVRATVRPGGVNVRAAPDVDSARLGSLREGDQVRVEGLVFRDFTWLRVRGNGWGWGVPWAWVAGEYTDFSRSVAYDQVTDAWYESAALLDFRRVLARDMLRVRGVKPDKLQQVDTISSDALRVLEDTLTRQTVPAQYSQFWDRREHLGLPAPFEYLAAHCAPPATIIDVLFNGFGPNTFAFHNWEVYYKTTRGMHNGIDIILPEGSPLIAVADGEIVDFRFLKNSAERSLALRPYLPDSVRNRDGARVLSNVIVAYGHLTGDPSGDLVQSGDDVRAGDIIGTSGWPVYTRDDGSVGIQYNNAHLHLEVHLVTDGTRTLGNRTPFNPLLFWTPRLIAWQARLAAHGSSRPYPQSGQPYGRLGFFTVGAFSYDPSSPTVWEHEPSRDAVWPKGVYDLDTMLDWLETFEPYAPRGLMEAG